MGGGAATGAGVTGTTPALTDNGRMAGAGGGNVAMGVRAGCLGGVGAGCAGGVGELMVACEERARATRHVRAKEASERATNDDKRRRQETTVAQRQRDAQHNEGEEAKKRRSESFAISVPGARSDFRSSLVLLALSFPSRRQGACRSCARVCASCIVHRALPSRGARCVSCIGHRYALIVSVVGFGSRARPPQPAIRLPRLPLCSALRTYSFTWYTMSKRGTAGSVGNKFRITCGLPVGAVINCADNTGAKNLYIIAVTRTGARLNRLPSGSVGDMVLATVKKGKPELRKKVTPAVIVRQRKAWRRKDGTFIYFEGMQRER